MMSTRTTAAALAVIATCALGVTGHAQAAKAEAPKLAYFPKAEVDENFVHHKGMDDTLYTLDHQNGHYIVKTTGREKTLAAETHATFTDILYIVKGSATLVYGGKLVDDITPKTYPDGTPFNETKMAKRIEGGETRRLSVGDVVVIPNGMPHWFTEVSGPFWFFNVKSR